MLIGPSVPGLYASTERVHLVSELGVTVLLALEYRQEAAKLDSENKLPEIGERPAKLCNERRRAA